MTTIYWSVAEPEYHSSRWVMRPGMQIDTSTFVGKPEELPPSNFAVSPLAYYDPILVRNTLQQPLIDSSYAKCPAFTAYTQNMYALKFPFDYTLQLQLSEDGSLSANTIERDQTFFESYIKLMAGEKYIFQVTPRYMFLSEKPLIMSLLHPAYHNNSITKLGHVLSGEYDIGRWARLAVMGFYLHETNCEMKLNRGDVYTYVKFNTKDKVTLKQFHYTQDMNAIITSCARLKNTTTKVFSLKGSYDAYKRLGYHKLILKEIKKNLI